MYLAGKNDSNIFWTWVPTLLPLTNPGLIIGINELYWKMENTLSQVLTPCIIWLSPSRDVVIPMRFLLVLASLAKTGVLEESLGGLLLVRRMILPSLIMLPPPAADPERLWPSGRSSLTSPALPLRSTTRPA